MLQAISAERLRELRTMPYEEYLQTPEWRIRRDRALVRAGWRCTLCAARKHLEAHHNCYDNLGDERDEDLTVVCSECHERHHFSDRFDRELRVYLLAARSRIYKRSFASMTEVAEDVKQTFAELRLSYDSQLVTDVLARLKPDIDERRAEVQVYLFSPRSYFHIAANATASQATKEIEAAYRRIKTFPAPHQFAPTDEGFNRTRQHAHALVGQPDMRSRLDAIFRSSKEQDADLAQVVKEILDIDRYVRRFKQEERGNRVVGEDGL